MKKLSINTESIIYFFAILISLSALDVYYEPLKQIKYLLLPLSLVFVMPLLSRNKINLGQPKTMLCFVLLLCHGLFISPVLVSGYNVLLLKDIFFITSYALPLILFFDTTNKINIKTLFVIYTLGFLVSVPGEEIKGFDILMSSAYLESSVSFVFGAFALYFLFNKRYILLVLAIAAMVITMKRIAILGFLTSALLWYTPVLVKKNIINKYTCTVVGLVSLCLLYLLYMGHFDALISEYTGMNPMWFTMGRLAHWGGVFDEIHRNPLLLILGNGCGSGYEYATIYANLFSKSYNHDHYNLHSDLLKIVFEYGVLVFVAYFSILFSQKSTQAKLLILYLFILYISDNVLIYVSVMFFVMLIVLQAEKEFCLENEIRCRK